MYDCVFFWYILVVYIFISNIGRGENSISDFDCEQSKNLYPSNLYSEDAEGFEKLEQGGQLINFCVSCSRSRGANPNCSKQFRILTTTYRYGKD